MMDTFDEYCLFMEHDKSLQCILARHFIYIVINVKTYLKWLNEELKLEIFECFNIFKLIKSNTVSINILTPLFASLWSAAIPSISQ